MNRRQDKFDTGGRRRYSAELRDVICDAIERGKTWRELEAMGVVPCSTLASWLRKYPDLQISYSFAIDLRLQSLVREFDAAEYGVFTASTRREASRMRKKRHAVMRAMSYCSPRAYFYYRTP